MPPTNTRNEFRRKSVIIILIIISDAYLNQTPFQSFQTQRWEIENLVPPDERGCEHIQEETRIFKKTPCDIDEGKSIFIIFHLVQNLPINGTNESRRTIHKSDHVDLELTTVQKNCTRMKHDEKNKSMSDSTQFCEFILVIIVLAQYLLTSGDTLQSDSKKHSFNKTSYHSKKHTFSDTSYHKKYKPGSKDKCDEVHGMYSSRHIIEHSPAETYESRLIVCPASLNTYFEKIGTTSSASIEEIMIYEWNRFRSFFNFPRESPVYAIELARAGFYHTGNHDEVVCFSCGARHSDWSTGDSPLGIHRQISPNCRFLNGNGTRNVRISDISSEGQNNTSQGPPLGKNYNEVQGNGNPTVHERANTSAITPSHGDISTGNENRRNFGQYRESRESNEAITDVFGILSQKPKYPRYAVLAIRISSFENWPRYCGIAPQSLAQAGLFYVGFGDNVRCFFCGGGMRNWEPQDDPWVEHARWFPRCPYVMQCQGSEFIRNVQQIAVEQSMPSASQVPATAYLSASAEGATGLNEEADMLSSVAAQSAIEMGYTEVTVKDAARKLTQQTGETNVILFIQIVLIFFTNYKCSHVTDYIRIRVGNTRVQEPRATSRPTFSQSPDRHSISYRQFSHKQARKDITRITDRKTGPNSPYTDADKWLCVFSAEELVSLIMDNEEKEIQNKSDGLKEHDAKNSNPRQGNHRKSNMDSEKETDDGVASNIDDNIRSLMQENRQMREESLCRICLEESSCIVFLPCGHMVTCPRCAPAFKKCPVCRKTIKGTVKAYLS
ncbi:hypothetical protein ScPMuIL_004391 [Solemya velum]